ncbi:MAG: hypothetical protein ACRDJO_08710 [Actinomycetota bacterium]
MKQSEERKAGTGTGTAARTGGTGRATRPRTGTSTGTSAKPGPRTGSANGGKAIVGTAGRQLAEQVDRRSSELGEKVASAAGAVRDVGRQFREQDRPGVAKLTEGVADRVEGIGGYLASRGPDELVADIKNLATREPLVFAGACFALGMFAARVVKAATHGSESSSSSGPTAAAPGASS